MPGLYIKEDNYSIVRIEQNSAPFRHMIKALPKEEGLSYLHNLNDKIKSTNVLVLSDVTIYYNNLYLDIGLSGKDSSHMLNNLIITRSYSSRNNYFAHSSKRFLIMTEDLNTEMYKIAMNLLQFRVVGILNNTIKVYERWFKNLTLDQKKGFLNDCGFIILSPKFTKKHFILSPGEPYLLNSVTSSKACYWFKQLYNKINNPYYIIYHGEVIPVIFPIGNTSNIITTKTNRYSRFAVNRYVLPKDATASLFYILGLSTIRANKVVGTSTDLQVLDKIKFIHIDNGSLPQDCYILLDDLKNKKFEYAPEDTNASWDNRRIYWLHQHTLDEIKGTSNSRSYYGYRTYQCIPSSLLR